MTEVAHRSFDDRAGFDGAVKESLALARKSIAIVDRDLQRWPFETLDGDTALRDALRRGARLRLLVADPTWLDRHGTRFMRIRRDFSDRVECRTFPATLRIDESAIVVDARHVARRPHQDAAKSLCANDDPAAALPVLGRFDAAWDESVPCLPASTLGL